MAASDEDDHCGDEAETDLLEDVYLFLTKKQYREGMTQNQKRIIRRGATNFRTVDGKLVCTKKLKGTNEVGLNVKKVLAICILFFVCIQVHEVRYIRERKEQLRIVHACHEDKTSGHLGYRKTLARITERFMWKGLSKDAKEIVSI